MKGLCEVEGCTKVAHSRNLCGSHYQRLRVKGSTSSHVPLGMGAQMAWLIANCAPQHEECVIWPFNIRSHGYGQITIKRRNTCPHREACRIHHGEPPSSEHEAAHSCGNRACVNVKHLRWATPVENAADRIIHGTHREGETAGPAKLTNQQAAMIRADRRTQRQIAADYGVTQKAICLIKRGETYKSAELSNEQQTPQSKEAPP